MSIQTNYIRLKKAMEQYAAKLNEYTEEEFVKTPADNKWSYAEVYAHITSANLMSIKGLEIAGNNKAEEVLGRVDWRVALILWAGRLPGGRKVPKRLLDAIVKMSKAEALEKIQLVQSRLEEVYPLVLKASPTQKIKHPRMGYLNSAQWLRFMEIHTYHHLKQLDRIHKLLQQ